MPRIRIPDLALPGFKALAELDEEKIQKLSQFLNSLPVGFKMSDLNDYLLSELEVSESRSIVQTLFSFRELLEHRNVNFQELSDSLVESYKDIETEISDEELAILKRNLEIIFQNSNSLKLTLKTKQLRTEDSKVYSDSKVITDIRLIFNDDIEESNRNGVVIHKLHFEFFENKELNDFFISLDLSELKELKEHIDRAIKKDETIQKDYESTIHFINPNK